jgi:hypothetical protein
MQTQKTLAPTPALSDTPQERPHTPAGNAPARVTFLLDVDGSIQQIETPPGDAAGPETGLDPGSLVSTSLFRHVHECDLLPLFRGVAELVDGQEEEVPVGFRLRTGGGLWRAVQGTMRLCSDGRTIAGLLLTLQFLAALT